MTPRQDLANEVISAGLRALAVKRHLDTGGTNDEMRELNEAVEWLREFVEGNKPPATPVIVPQPPVSPAPPVKTQTDEPPMWDDDSEYPIFEAH
jgi:hypothetical protein